MGVNVSVRLTHFESQLLKADSLVNVFRAFFRLRL